MLCDPSDLFITNAECRRMLGVCAKSVRKLAERNKVRTRRMPGLRVVRYHRHDIEKVLNAADHGAAVRSA